MTVAMATSDRMADRSPSHCHCKKNRAATAPPMRRAAPTRCAGPTCGAARSVSSTASCPGCISTAASWRRPSNPNHPLLERLRFLSISANNLDEFFMVRVAGLKGQQRAGHRHESATTAHRRPSSSRASARRCRRSPATSRRAGASCATSSPSSGIVLVDGRTIDRSRARPGWRTISSITIFPVLTPLAIDPAHPFPFIPNLGFTLALQLVAHSDGQRDDRADPHAGQARPLHPPAVDRRAASTASSASSRRSALFIARLFPGYAVEGQGAFRVIRDSDIEVEEEAEDLVRFFESALKRRRRGSVIRLEIEAAMPDELRALRRRARSASPATRSSWSTACWRSTTCRSSSRIDRPDLEVRALHAALPRAHPRPRRRLLRRDPRRRTSIVHHPYESFDVVVQFLRQAARDPDVVAIKQTLYRTSNDSPDRARAGRGGRGRQVGDRAGRAQGALRRGGQHPLGARPRARRRAGGLRLHRAEDPRQAVAGGAPRGRRSSRPTSTSAPATITRSPRASTPTCRSSPPTRRSRATSRASSTSSPAMPSRPSSSGWRSRRSRCASASSSSSPQEIAHAKAGRPAAIWMKLNALVDPADHRRALRRQPAPACEIDLVVRGICCLRPGIPGPVREHPRQVDRRPLPRARAASSASATATACRRRRRAVYIGSADMMPRNLDRRVEAHRADPQPDRARAGARPDHGRQPHGQPAELAGLAGRQLEAHQCRRRARSRSTRTSTS